MLNLGQKVERSSGLLAGEQATIEQNPETMTYLQASAEYGVEYWIRYKRDGVHLPNRAILTPHWVGAEEIVPR
jgi:hypothetical protein